jgi:dTDP-4-amino-4,6-dideoxygalactose transaminase
MATTPMHTNKASASGSSALALLGGEPVGAPKPWTYPSFTDEARARVDKLLAKGDVVGLSKAHPVIREAEEAIAAWQGVPHCLLTSTGHASLHAALIGLEVTGGDEVITSPYTWGATISPILHNGAVPTFADVLPDTGLLNPDAIEAAITPRTRAIMVPHLYAQPADMTRICEIAKRHSLVVIEDGSQAHGARHRGQLVGTFGDAAGFSCMGKKLLAAFESGYLVTKRSDVYWKAGIACMHPGASDAPGRTAEPGFPDELNQYVDTLLYTYRGSTVNAVLLVEQLKKLETENDARRSNRKLLLEALDGIRSVSFPEYASEDDPAFHMITMNFDAEYAGISKETYVAALAAEGAAVFSYIKTPLSKVPRLAADYAGPRVMWTEHVRRSGVDYSAFDLPGCECKIARSIEINWNWIEPAPDAVRAVADAFIKVEEHLDDLRRHEASAGGSR